MSIIWPQKDFRQATLYFSQRHRRRLTWFLRCMALKISWGPCGRLANLRPGRHREVIQMIQALGNGKTSSISTVCQKSGQQYAKALLFDWFGFIIFDALMTLDSIDPKSRLESCLLRWSTAKKSKEMKPLETVTTHEVNPIA